MHLTRTELKFAYLSVQKLLYAKTVKSANEGKQTYKMSPNADWAQRDNVTVMKEQAYSKFSSFLSFH